MGKITICAVDEHNSGYSWTNRIKLRSAHPKNIIPAILGQIE